MVRESVVPCPCGCHCHPDEILARINTELAGAGRAGWQLGVGLQWPKSSSHLSPRGQDHGRSRGRRSRCKAQPRAHSLGTAREGPSGKGVQKGTPRRSGTLVSAHGGPLREGMAV